MIFQVSNQTHLFASMYTVREIQSITLVNNLITYDLKLPGDCRNNELKISL